MNRLFLLSSLLIISFHGVDAIFFSQLGLGSMNCRCQESCAQQIGCMCPPMSCFQQAPTFYTQPPPPYQPYQPPQSFVPNFNSFMGSYAQPSVFTTPPPPPPPVQPPPQNINIPEPSYRTSDQQINLMPPPASSERMEQLILELEQAKPVNQGNQFEYGTGKPLSKIFYEYNTFPKADNGLIETDTVPTTTFSTSSESASNPGYELMRGEGNSDISASGYRYPTSTVSPVLLEFLEEPSKFEHNQSPNFTDANVNAFTTQVDNFYKTSTNNPRDARESEKNEEPQTIPESSKFQPTMEEDNWMMTKKEDNKCNNSMLKSLMEMKMTGSPSISKQIIYTAATELYPGRNVNVICSKHSFSYVVVTSPIFCEHRKKALTCFVFFQP